eukprot:TRINITY_DN70811_c0_g1_i1.p1 TRINITY_DN70811_c0_g1~~TRINITY_DN70811_c0_g1_i1.p1  ORF type:complete len:843 (+),score=312.63 TRINITY_DN70811_c0_g1_i1:93-2621(+)
MPAAAFDDGAEPRITRCKLYQLGQGDWKPVGVGHAWVDVKDGGGAGGRLLMVDEEDPRNILVTHSIDCNSQAYERQQLTLILFTDQATQDEFGLSFEKADGCAMIWKQLCKARGVTCGPPPPGSEEPQRVSPAAEDVPPADNLPELAAFLDNFFGPNMQRLLHVREQVVAHIIQQGYLAKVFEQFDEAEKEQDVATMHVIWRVLRSLLLFNSTEMLRELVSGPNIRKVIGCFEYNPNRPTKRLHHREYLEQVQFNDPLHLDEGLHERITQVHLVQYLKDTVVASVLDDVSYESLNSYLLITRNDILRNVVCSEDNMTTIFSVIANPESAKCIREQLLLFLEEMVVCAKTLPPQHRADFLEYLVKQGLFDVLIGYICDDDEKMRHAVAGICWSVALDDVNHIRNFCLDAEQKSKGCLFLRMLFHQTVKEEVEGLQSQWADIVRLIVETAQQKSLYTLQGACQPPEVPPGFLAVLFERLPPENPVQEPIIDTLFRGVVYHPANITQDKVPEIWESMYADDARNVHVNYTVLPLVTSCIIGHPHRMGPHLIQNDLPPKVIRMLNRPRVPRILLVAVLWFIRALVASNVTMLHAYIIEKDILEPVFAQLAAVRGGSCDMITSTALSIVDVIWKENCQALLEHCVTKYSEVLNGRMAGTEVGKMFVKRHEQNVDRKARYGADAVTGTIARPNPDGRTLGSFAPKLQEQDSSEARYFDTDEEPGAAAAEGALGSLATQYDDQVAQMEGDDQGRKRKRSPDAAEEEGQADEPQPSSPKQSRPDPAAGNAAALAAAEAAAAAETAAAGAAPAADPSAATAAQPADADGAARQPDPDAMDVDAEPQQGPAP